MQHKQSWGLRVLNKAAHVVGLSVIPQRFAGGYNRILKLFGNAVVFGIWNEKDYVKSYSEHSTLYSIINRITRTAATAPFKVYRIKDKKKHLKYKAWTGANATRESISQALLIKELVYEEDSDHPLNKLLEKPNPWQNAAEFTISSIGFKLLTGNRMLLLTTLDMGANAGRAISLVNLPSQSVSVQSDGTLFGVKDYILNINEPVVIPAANIIHSKYWNPNIDGTGSHLKGLSPLSAGSRPLDIVEAGEVRALTSLRNAGANGMIFDKAVSDLSPEEAGALKVKINQEVLGMENTGSIALGNGDLGYLDFSKSAQDLGTLEEKKYAKQELCNIFGVPYVMFSSENSTYNNIQEAKKELLTMAVVPELASLREDWNLLGDGLDVYIDYDLSVYPELQEDMEKTGKIMAAAWWIKPNEKRIAMGFDEDSEEMMMNRYLVPTGLTDISQLDPEKIQASLDEAEAQESERERIETEKI